MFFYLVFLRVFRYFDQEFISGLTGILTAGILQGKEIYFQEFFRVKHIFTWNSLAVEIFSPGILQV